MDKKRRILILGDSHTRGLRKALAVRTSHSSTTEFEIHWLLSEKVGQSRGNLRIEDALTKISGLGPNDILGISVLGTAHNIFGLLQHEQPFDFALTPTGFAYQGGASVIPHRVISDTFEDSMRRNKYVKGFCETARCKVCHLAPPPPKGDNDFVLEHAKTYRGMSAAETGITPAWLRLKLWELEMLVLQSVCKDWNMQFFNAPEQSRTVDGFLKPEFYGKDATHANIPYGELMLTELENHVW